MTKKHILKKKETRFFKSLGPVTEENALDYPIGNPFRVKSKDEAKEFTKAILKYRLENLAKQSAEDKERQDELIAKIRAEFRAESKLACEKAKRDAVRRLFFKVKH